MMSFLYIYIYGSLWGSLDCGSLTSCGYIYIYIYIYIYNIIYTHTHAHTSLYRKSSYIHTCLLLRKHAVLVCLSGDLNPRPLGGRSSELLINRYATKLMYK